MTDILPHLLLALAAVIIAGRLLAKLFGYIGQPPVIGEVAAGILLGPSLLGKEISGLILPDAVAPNLKALAQLGVVLYMFLVGLELNGDWLRRRLGSAVAISQAGIVLPFLLGVGLALWLYPLQSYSQVPLFSFALFMGVSLSITAFPVLARILHDRGMDKTDLGALALGCAAVGDLTAWCLLAFVVGVAQARVDSATLVAVLALAFVVFVIVIVRPLVCRLAKWCEDKPIGPALLAWTIVAVLLAALATELIGLHSLFGAFLLGAVIPHESRLARQVHQKLHGTVTVLLLPAFFAYTGMRTEIGLVAGWEQWLIVLVIILTATAGKLIGTAAGARLTGLDWTTSLSLGVLMNTRGLMELIVLNVGLELGVITPTLFAMMVLMALVTTMATTPLMDLLGRAQKGRSHQEFATARDTADRA